MTEFQLRFLLLFALCSLLSSKSFARFNLGGYAKSLDFVSRETQTRSYEILSGNRLRLDTEWQDREQLFDFRLIVDHEFLVGSSLSAQRTAINSGFQRNELLQLNWILNEKENLIWRHSFYRAYLKWRMKNLDAAIGRERIAWGQGRIWTPTDTINPYDPLSVEREERAGSDALDLKWNANELSFLEMAYVPRSKLEWEQSLLLGRAHLNFKQMDWEFMGGKIEDERIIGFNHAAQIFEGSIRSELTYNFHSALRKDFLRALLSYDYSFSLKQPLYLLAEFYYNGIGERDKNDYARVLLKQNDQQFFGKDYLGLGLTYEFSSLWKAESYGILNLDDGSAFIGPQIRWQPIKDLEMTIGYQAFLGSAQSEFGGRRDIAFLQLQWFFSVND